MASFGIGKKVMKMTDGSREFLRIRSGTWVRKFDGSTKIPAAWTQMWVGGIIRVGLDIKCAGESIPAAGVSGPQMPLFCWGLSNGDSGSLAQHDVHANITNWVGYRSAASGQSNTTVRRSGGSYDGNTYLEWPHFPQAWQNGSKLSSSAGITFHAGMDYWSGFHFRISRSAGTYTINSPQYSAPANGDVAIAEVVDILNAGDTEPAIRNYGVSTYGWTNNIGGSHSAAMAEATYGYLTHLEVGAWGYMNYLDLDDIVIKAVL